MLYQLLAGNYMAKKVLAAVLVSTCLFSTVVMLCVNSSASFIVSASSSTGWKQTYGGDGWCQVESVIQTSDGGYALAGTNRIIIDDDLAGYYAWLIKTDPEGNIPEFPLWTIIPSVLIATVALLLFKKRLSKRKSGNYL